MKRTFIASVLLLASCSNLENDDPEFSLAGKADFLSKSQTLGYDETSIGTVNGEEFSIYSLAVKQGDAFKIILKRTSGDFDPRSVLYDNTLETIPHQSGTFIWSEIGNSKIFEVREEDSIHHIVVRANYYQGSGEFSINLHCIGGPCKQKSAP